MVISKKDLKNPEKGGIKYDSTSEAAGKLIDQKYADNTRHKDTGNLPGLHNTNEEAVKVNESIVEDHKRKTRIIY